MGYHFLPIGFMKVKHWEMSIVGMMKKYRIYYDLQFMDPGQPFWRAIWTYLIKLNTSICYSPSALPGHIFPQEIPTQKPKMICAKSLQSCPTLFDPIDGSPPGSPIPGILQARTPEWVAIAFSSAWKWKVKVKSLSRVRLLATPWTAAHQAPPSMGFSRQEYWSGVPLPSLKMICIRCLLHSCPSPCIEMDLHDFF